MKKQTVTIIITILICVTTIAYVTFSFLHKAQSTIDEAVELGKAPMDKDTSVYLRVYEDNAHRFYLNGHLIEFTELEKRAEKLDNSNGIIYYSNQTPSEKIPKNSKIFNLLKDKQLGFTVYEDSLFTKPYY